MRRHNKAPVGVERVVLGAAVCSKLSAVGPWWWDYWYVHCGAEVLCLISRVNDGIIYQLYSREGFCVGRSCRQARNTYSSNNVSDCWQQCENQSFDISRKTMICTVSIIPRCSMYHVVVGMSHVLVRDIFTGTWSFFRLRSTKYWPCEKWHLCLSLWPREHPRIRPCYWSAGQPVCCLKRLACSSSVRLAKENMQTFSFQSDTLVWKRRWSEKESQRGERTQIGHLWVGGSISWLEEILTAEDNRLRQRLLCV